MTETILIVDDSLTVRMDLAEAFEESGFTIRLAASVAEAREALAHGGVGIVVLDVVLPDGDGIELLREIRSNPVAGGPFVLLLSSEADVKDRVRGMQTGADDYVGKPYDVGYVIARSRELLGNRALRARAGGPGTVLIIDDSRTFREELKSALEASRYTVATAQSGEEGLRLAASLRPIAVLVDSLMPGIDGGAVIRRMRLDSALRATPCVLLTASDEQDAELHALDAGADAFVRKEDLELVLARLAAVLRNASVGPVGTSALLAPKRILVVDDSLTYLHELSTVLRGDGYDVVPARSGQECLEMLAAQPVDCILLDLQMPGMDGIETCRRLKTSSPLREVPLIMMTAREDRGAMIEALGSGADDFISKSSAIEVLKARVRAQLRRKQFEDEHRYVRERLLRSELVAAEARAERELLETRARLVEELERKNEALVEAYGVARAAQQQLVQSAKMASLGELVAGVAHEINNPLAFVISHLRTVQRSLAGFDRELRDRSNSEEIAPWEKAQSRLEEMSGGLERMRELVLKLRTFSRLDEGELKVMSLSEAFGSILTILGHRLRDEISVETRFAEFDHIECYAGLMNQALMNVVANAVDAIQGAGTIAISTSWENDECVIRVADSGEGIPEAHRDRVLEPFFTTKAVGEGTGLGLSITYSIMQKHDGSIALEPRPGGGTVATLRIPAMPEQRGPGSSVDPTEP